MDYNNWADQIQSAGAGLAQEALKRAKARNSPAALAAAAQAEAARYAPATVNADPGDMGPVGLGNALSAFGNAAVGDTAAFMSNPLMHKIYSALGMSAADLPPEAWRQLSQDAREEADYNVQHTGRSLLGRVPGYVGQMLGSLASTPGILSAVATAPIGGPASGLLGRAGLGKVGQILGSETIESVAQGSLQRGLQGDLNNAENLIGDVGGALLFGGARALKHLYDFSGTPGMERWMRTLTDGNGYGVRSVQRDNTAVPELAFGKSGFTVEEHADAWARLGEAAGLTDAEMSVLLSTPQTNALNGSVVEGANGALSQSGAGGVLEKLNKFAMSKPGKKLIDDLDEQYASEVWTTAHAIAKASPEIPDTPQAIAQVADLLHRQRRDAVLPDLSNSKLDDLVTGAGERGEKLNAAFKGWLPSTKVSSDTMKGIEPGQVDALLSSANAQRTQVPDLLPQAQMHLRDEYNDIVQRLAGFDPNDPNVDPDAWGAALANARARVLEMNDEVRASMQARARSAQKPGVSQIDANDPESVMRARDENAAAIAELNRVNDERVAAQLAEQERYQNTLRGMEEQQAAEAAERTGREDAREARWRKARTAQVRDRFLNKLKAQREEEALQGALGSKESAAQSERAARTTEADTKAAEKRRAAIRTKREQIADRSRVQQRLAEMERASKDESLSAEERKAARERLAEAKRVSEAAAARRAAIEAKRDSIIEKSRLEETLRRLDERNRGNVDPAQAREQRAADTRDAFAASQRRDAIDTKRRSIPEKQRVQEALGRMEADNPSARNLPDPAEARGARSRTWQQEAAARKRRLDIAERRATIATTRGGFLTGDELKYQQWLHDNTRADAAARTYQEALADQQAQAIFREMLLENRRLAAALPGLDYRTAVRVADKSAPENWGKLDKAELDALKEHFDATGGVEANGPYQMWLRNARENIYAFMHQVHEEVAPPEPVAVLDGGSLPPVTSEPGTLLGATEMLERAILLNDPEQLLNANEDMLTLLDGMMRAIESGEPVPEDTFFNVLDLMERLDEATTRAISMGHLSPATQNELRFTLASMQELLDSTVEVRNDAVAQALNAGSVAPKPNNDVEVTLFGAAHSFDQLKADGVVDELTSANFLDNLQRRAGADDDVRAIWDMSAEAAKLDAQTFDTYIGILENAVGTGVSLRLDPQNFAVTRELTGMLAAARPILERAGHAFPTNDNALLLRMISKYFATELHTGRITPEVLDMARTQLNDYVAAYQSGTLTQAQHADMLNVFGKLLDNVTVHANMDPGTPGKFDYHTGKIELAAKSELDVAVHEIAHALTHYDPALVQLMKNVAEELTTRPDQQAQLAHLVGTSMSPANVRSDMEHVVRLMQAYFVDPKSTRAMFPTITKQLEKALKKLDEPTRNLIDYLSAVQKAAHSMRQGHEYRYEFLEQFTGKEFDFNAAEDAAEIGYMNGDIRETLGAISERVDGLLASPNGIIAQDEATYDFIADLLTATNTPSRPFAPFLMPDHPLTVGTTGTATSAMHAHSARVTDRIVERAVSGRAGLSRVLHALAPTDLRANSLDATGAHVEPHIAAMRDMTEHYARGLNAWNHMHVNSLYDQDWLPALTNTKSENASAALERLATGRRPELKNAADIRVMADAHKLEWQRGAWLNDAEIDALPMSPESKAAMKFMTREVMEVSNAVKQTHIENMLARHPDLQSLRGQNMSAEALLASDRLTNAQKDEIRTINDIFRPGYRPTTRTGDFFVHGVRDGELIASYSAKTAADAKKLRDELARNNQFGDGVEWNTATRPETTPIANRLDGHNNLASDLISYLRETESGRLVTEDDLEAVLARAHEPGRLTQYFERRRNIPGWEDEDPIERHLQFVRSAGLYIHGQELKRGTRELIARGGLDTTARNDVRQFFDNTMNNASGIEEVLSKTFKRFVPNSAPLRSYSQALRKFAYNLTLGFSNPRRVALDAAHVMQITLNDLSAEASSLMRAYGTNGGAAYATRRAAASTRTAIDWLFGNGHDGPEYAAYKRAVELGYVQSAIDERIARPEIGGTNGGALLNALTRQLDFMGHRSGALRDALSFHAFYKMYEELSPNMSEEARIVFAGEAVMRSLNLRASNRPTLPGFNGEVANQMLSFKGFLGNAMAKAVHRMKRAFGQRFVEVPNDAWHPGADPSVPKNIVIEHRDAASLIKFVATSSLIGGTMGVPFVGYMLGILNAVTGRDLTYETRHWLEQNGGEPGRFLGALVDKGLADEYIGFDLSELGNLVLPTPEDGITGALMPISLSIIGTRRSALANALDPDATEDPAIQAMRAVLPSAVQRLADIAQLVENNGRIFTSDGRLIRESDPIDYLRTFFGGMNALRADTSRVEEARRAQSEEYNSAQRKAAASIARKILNNEPPSEADAETMRASRKVHQYVREALRNAETPVLEKLRSTHSKDAEEQRLRREFWRAYVATVDEVGDSGDE
jgi:hypothetical protein